MGKPLILFLHGLGESRRCFDPLLARLGDLRSRFDLRAPDFHGFGGAPRPSGVERVSLRLFAEQALSAVAERRPERLHLVAHSMGGAVALRMRRLAPDLAVESFLDLEGNLLPEDCTFSARIAAEDRAEFEAAGFARFKTSLERLAASGDASAADWRAGLELTTAGVFHDAAADLVRASRDAYPVYRDWPVRKLYVYGERSAVPSTRARLLADGQAVATIPGAGHVMMRDRPAETEALLRALISGAGPGR